MLAARDPGKAPKEASIMIRAGASTHTLALRPAASLLPIVLLIALLASCAASPPRIGLRANGDQDIDHARGVACAYDELRPVGRPGEVMLMVCPGRGEGGLARVELGFINATPGEIDIGPGTVSATDARGRRLSTLAHDRLARRERNRRFWAGVGTGLAAFANSLAAATAGTHTETITHYEPRSYCGPGGCTTLTVPVQTVVTWHDPHEQAWAEAEAEANNIALFEGLRARNEAAGAAIDNALRPTRLAPGARHLTFIELALPAPAAGTPASAWLQVEIEGARTRFEITVAPR